MARMFCTFQEAAAILDATETELEALLADGALAEFRDGSTRFLKVADIDALMAQQAGGVALKAPPDIQAQATGPESAPDVEATSGGADEIRLPPCAAVKVKTRYCQDQPAPAPPGPRTDVSSANRNVPPKRPSASKIHPHLDVPTPVLAARATRPQTREMSLREWIWAGLLDDRPGTLIFLLFATLVGVCGVGSALYLLARLLGK